jgi:protein arginine kinase
MGQNLSALLQHTPWEEDKNPIWLASSFILLRNFNKYKFPSKLSEAGAKTLLNSLRSTLEKTSELKNPLFFPAEELSLLDKELLFEHFFCMESFQEAAAGQGFIIDDSYRILALLNLKNHLQLYLLDPNNDLTSAWCRLNKIETEISKSLEYAFSPKFGYLTSDPTQCGTALVALQYLHLPALIHTKKLSETSKQLDEDVAAMGLEGSLEDPVGDVVILRNHYTLGLTEETILHELQSNAMKLMASEKALRTHLKEENNGTIKDLISRALGLLMHSYQLQTKEALGALSLIKLGIDLGWITGASDTQINQIFFQCRRAHLAHSLKETTADTQEIARKRAEFIHKELQKMELH